MYVVHMSLCKYVLTWLISESQKPGQKGKTSVRGNERCSYNKIYCGDTTLPNLTVRNGGVGVYTKVLYICMYSRYVCDVTCYAYAYAYADNWWSLTAYVQYSTYIEDCDSGVNDTSKSGPKYSRVILTYLYTYTE